MEKKSKAVDELKKWLKENFKEGAILERHSSPNVFVLNRTKFQDFEFSYKLKPKSKEKPPK